MPGTRSGASLNQKNATQSPLPASKKKCWPGPVRQIERLDQRHAKDVAVEVDGLLHVRAHQSHVVDAAEFELGIGIVGLIMSRLLGYRPGEPLVKGEI